MFAQAAAAATKRTAEVVVGDSDDSDIVAPKKVKPVLDDLSDDEMPVSYFAEAMRTIFFQAPPPKSTTTKKVDVYDLSSDDDAPAPSKKAPAKKSAAKKSSAKPKGMHKDAISQLNSVSSATQTESFKAKEEGQRLGR